MFFFLKKLSYWEVLKKFYDLKKVILASIVFSIDIFNWHFTTRRKSFQMFNYT